jgi:RecA/RadA recombinase
MARKKTSENQFRDSSTLQQGTQEHANLLKQAFNEIITQKYGSNRPPKPYVTPTGIASFDALLGGGIVSSAPVMISSTPETGKSTIAFQFSKIFLDTYPNSVVVYCDIEGAGSDIENAQVTVNRIDAFGIDKSRIQYERIVLTVEELFDALYDILQVKKKFEEQTNTEFKVLFVWDSVKATPPSKLNSTDDPNKIIGVKARLLSHLLDKYMPDIKFSRLNFLLIDQIRAKLKIEGPYVATEKTVGQFKDFRAATQVQNLNHLTAQWIYLSKKEEVSSKDNYTDVDGWKINCFLDKNKLAPSKIIIKLVFDKIYGVNKFWTEFEFLANPCPSEEKLILKAKRSLIYPLSIKRSGAYYYLEVIDPSTGEILYVSDKCYMKEMLDYYNSNEEFRQWFDYSAKVSSYMRITKGLFKIPEQERQKNIDGMKHESELNVEIKEQGNNESEITVTEEIEQTSDTPVYESVFS